MEEQWARCGTTEWAGPPIDNLWKNQTLRRQQPKMVLIPTLKLIFKKMIWF
ncbi:hypothetical protein [Chromobacterium amazonense]|uniref:hypothetical protein n=1 Tax=Chromobacterium amazonense TaxID=1382803 RepID=UPI0016702450|nr:hypothetical protein [Chromobacterium amazonense]